MSLYKYYELTTDSSKELSTLERNIKSALLQERHLDSVLMLPAPGEQELTTAITKVPPAEEQRDLYDLSTFDLLYFQTQKLTQKGWWRKTYQFGIEMVIKGEVPDLRSFQQYIDSANFKVVQARDVNSAIFEFWRSANKIGIETYFQRIKSLVQREFPGVHFEYTKQDGSEGTMCHFEFCFSGPVNEVCHLRRYMLKTEAERSSTFHHSTLFR